MPLPANAWLQAHTPQPEFSYEQALAHGGPEAESAKVMADAEEADNELEFKRRSGDPVVYGQVVQLYHTASRQYVRTSSSITSRREPSHLKVDLSSETTRNSWFRIMPRYKVRAEGDRVRMNDQIVLESVETPGQYLHTSTLPYQHLHPDSGCHEVNLSVQRTAIVIYPHISITDDKTGYIRGGTVIQLLHKEIGAYLAAEGSVVGGPLEDIHLRVRLPDPARPSRAHPPTSAVSVRCSS